MQKEVWRLIGSFRKISSLVKIWLNFSWNPTSRTYFPCTVPRHLRFLLKDHSPTLSTLSQENLCPHCLRFPKKALPQASLCLFHLRFFQESHIPAPRFIQINFAYDFPRGVHVEDGHAAVNHLHAIISKDIGDCPAAALIHLAKL